MKKITLFLSCLILIVASVSTAQDDRLQIVASHSILADVVSNVAGDVADITSTMPVGADPHSFEPVPSDITALADADVVFINGAFFEEGLLEAIENADTDMNIVTASSCVQVIGFDGHSEDDHDHEEGEEHADDDHEHEEGEEHAADDHEHEEGEEHAADDHEHEEGEEHADDDHEHEEGEEHADDMGDMSEIAQLCQQHVAEMEAIHEADDDHEHEDDEHADEDHEHEDDEHADEDHEHEHAHSEMETLGFLYAVDCGDGHGHEGEEEHADEEEHSDEDHAHDHGACDPHVWMEPHNVMYWTMLIRDTLIDLDPANAETYSANADSYLAVLDELSHDFVSPMVETVPEANRIIITSHDSLGYFAARYDFEIATTIIPGGSTLAEPSASDVAGVIDLVNAEGVMAIFAETTVSDAVAQTISAETGAQLYTLYSGSLGDENSPASTYIDYIRYNVTTIVEALGGGM